MQPTTLQLRHFRESLERYMPREDMRPFTCSDNPYDCRIFLVGTNPATPLRKPFFYTYWSDSKGFLRDKFEEDYSVKRGKSGPTRRRIEEFVCGASPIPCLETNIYAISTASPNLRKEDKDTTIFEFLLREIEPDAIFLFRRCAVKYFQKCFKVDNINSNEFVTVDVYGHKTHVLRLRPHLRFEACKEAYCIGKIFKGHLQGDIK